MIYRFRLISNEKEDFYRDFVLKDDQTFFDFHMIIQEELNYDKSHLASFFVSNSNWEKIMEITLVDMTDPIEEDSSIKRIMASFQLSEMVKVEYKHLLYTFDFFSERSFFIELVEITKDNPKLKYPSCIEKRGAPPAQLSIEDIENIENIEDII